MTLTTRIGRRSTRKRFTRRDQFAPEIVYFSDCVREGRDPEPGGREGLADVRIIRALTESARTGAPVRLPAFGKEARPKKEQRIVRPAVREPDPVHATPPQGD